ncbi:hypothetical protein NDU88_005895 [Pleurodeles waltl]|uniref:Uncharacterized protein n=1 Tax=Pleurodeles waltl TaxID=8319 RepID=A0AAV7TC18_PLEWA|nr:hypothetical protein NDU88_005895 [Pleurodeles waltl]
MHTPLVPQIWFPSAPPLRPVVAAPERRRPAGAPTAALRCLLFSSSPLGPSSRPSPGRARGRSRASPPWALSASSTARRAGRRPIPPPLLLGGPRNSGPPHLDSISQGRSIGSCRPSRDPLPHSRPRLSAARKAASPPRADGPIYGSRTSQVKDNVRAASGVRPQPHARFPLLCRPELARFSAKVLAAPPELGDQACAISLQLATPPTSLVERTHMAMILRSLPDSVARATFPQILSCRGRDGIRETSDLKGRSSTFT